jgi:hypothetical protein
MDFIFQQGSEIPRPCWCWSGPEFTPKNQLGFRLLEEKKRGESHTF